MLNADRKMGVGVVGLGWWGPNLVRNFKAYKRVKKIVGCEEDATIAREQKRNLDIEVVTHIKRLLEDASIDGIAIATPARTHFALARECLESGKHVFIEKPPVQNLRELDILNRLALRKHLVLMADFTFVYHEAIKRLKKIIERKISDITYIQIFRWNNDITRQPLKRIFETKTLMGETVLSDLVYHELAVLTYLLGGRCRVKSNLPVHALWTRSYDTTFVAMEINKVPVDISLSWTTPERKKEMVVYFKNSYIRFNDMDPSKQLTKFNYLTKEEKNFRLSKEMPLANATKAFVDTVLDGCRTPVTGYPMMRKVLTLYDRIKNCG